MQPDQAKFLLTEVFLPGLTNEHGITTRVIQAIPPDQGDFRPDGISRSALDLAWHIASVEITFLRAVMTGAFDLNPLVRDQSIRDSLSLGKWYGANFAEQLQKLKDLPPEHLTKIIDFRGMFQLPAVMYLDFLLHHSIHHRGQLSMYLRPIGAKVPAMYGESFDSAEARKAVSQ